MTDLERAAFAAGVEEMRQHAVALCMEFMQKAFKLATDVEDYTGDAETHQWESLGAFRCGRAIKAIQVKAPR